MHYPFTHNDCMSGETFEKRRLPGLKVVNSGPKRWSFLVPKVVILASQRRFSGFPEEVLRLPREYPGFPESTQVSRRGYPVLVCTWCTLLLVCTLLYPVLHYPACTPSYTAS